MIQLSESMFKQVKRELGVKGGQSYDMITPQPYLHGDEDAKTKVHVEQVSDDCIAVNYTGGCGAGREWGQLACDGIRQHQPTNSIVQPTSTSNCNLLPLRLSFLNQEHKL